MLLRASFWEMLLYAFIGGLILNVMPCVLPVIALKVLGFVGQGRDAPRRVRALGLIYGLGVLASFLLLAGLVIGVKAAGHKAGWGMQFGSPQFLVALTTLVTLIALNLFGLFEVSLGGRVLGAAGGLAAKHGPAGAFFNGVLATVLATPCTAPFLGAALGFAFTQPPPVIVLVFLTVGLGLAAPYVVLSWNPRWLRFLPKPGP
jgi:thiol:disulfide interchange protein